ncbi:RNA-directed DNA polymerase from mobile element jockey [Elysia marginata]|uniref:RNA-directed DNA polymerase from mobile element jockey n=1 Tax=Elysia marginata TaxID=1093978 RepID=A0AAV4FCH2_9GAST|nr:RNA-directed DNA polymerase from mobile element jockey [Elysia marginata]
MANKARAKPAPGPKEMPYLLYKRCPSVLKWLHKILRSACTNIKVIKWMTAEGVYIPKEQNSKKIDQFRPISLLNLEAIFNLFTEYIFRTIDNIPGLTVGGININNLRYADDTVMLAENEDDLQKLVNIVKEESEKCGLFINIRKTKTMVISREKVIPQIDIKIDGERVEQVANFTYLGHWITEDGRSDQEVKRRIGMAKNTFSRMSKLLTNRRISFATKSRLTKCYVWSIFLYACETWTLNASLERSIEALEMWLYRRMARISWKENKKNKEVLEE